VKEFARQFTVGADHPSLAGHFPGKPIVPGVLLLDLILTEIQASVPQATRLNAIPNAKFQRPVKPNETVDVSIRIGAGEQPQMLRVRFQASVAGRPAAEGVFLLTIDAPDCQRMLS